MGKYDKQVCDSIYCFELNPNTDVSSINDIIQTNYIIVRDYYAASIAKINVISMLVNLKLQYMNDNYIDILDSYINEMSNSIEHTEEEAINSIIKIGSCALTAISLLSSISETQIRKEAYELYSKKTSAYNDVWYVRGMEGICVDINRKIARINSILSNESNCCDGETLIDTFMDTLIFSSFLLVGAKFFK